METNSEKIEKWILGVIEDGSWKNHNDLHIDEIDLIYKKNNKDWVKAGLDFFNIARKFIKEKKLPFIVELFFDLLYKEKLGDYVVKNMQELQSELSDTPPSLYLFHKDHIDSMTNKDIKEEKVENFLGVTDDVSIYYYQQHDEEYDEVNRGLYLM